MIHALRLPLAAVLLAGAVGLVPGALAAPPLSGPFGTGPTPGHAPAGAARYAGRRLQDGREAAATVLAGIDKLFEFAGDDEVPNKLQTAAFLDREIAPYFDFAYMAEFVAGPAWQGMGPQQRKALAAQLESRILSGVARRLLTPPGQRLRYVRPRAGKRESVDVRVGLSSPTRWRGSVARARQQPLVFRMYRTGDGWKVFDVLADGRSVIASYRDGFEGAAGDLPRR